MIQIMDSPRPDLPCGQYYLGAALDDRLRALGGAPPRGADGAAHPVFAFVMALGGMGLPIAVLSERLGLAFSAGPLLAGCTIDYHAPLIVGRNYDVAAEIAELRRKPSRRFGAADHLHLLIMLSRAGMPCAETRLHILFPAQELT